MSKPLIEVQGFPELKRKIQSLANDKIKRKKIENILKLSAKLLGVVAKAEAPKNVTRKFSFRGRKKYNPGVLKKSIKATVMKKSRIPMVVAGPSSRGVNDGYYGRIFVIPGHNVFESGFKRDKRGKNKLEAARRFNNSNATGRVDPNPFMKRAFDKSGAALTVKTVRQIEKEVQKQIDRL